MAKLNVRIEQKRRLIIETAATLFTQKGFHQTSIRDISKMANISLGSLYNYFKGKDSLIAAIALLEADENELFQKKLSSTEKPIANYCEFIDIYISVRAQEADAQLSAEILSEALRNPDIAEGFICNQKMLTESLAELLKLGKSDKTMQFEHSSKLTALLIIDFLESTCIKSSFYSGKLKKEYLEEIKHFCLLMVTRPKYP